MLRDHCYDIVLNVHALFEDKSDDAKDNFYEELEYISDQFPKYHMEILLQDFSAKLNICLSHEQNAGLNHNLKIASKSFKNVAMTVMNQN
jgi:lipoate synthase